MNANRPLGHAQLAALQYVAANPGCCAAEVDRACRTAKGGHQWMYNAIDRLARRGLISRARAGRKVALAVTDAGRAAIGGAA